MTRMGAKVVIGTPDGKKPSNDTKTLPDGVPALIEVDFGHRLGWVTAEVLKADERYIYFKLDGKTRKVPRAGEGMCWRVA
jgi:hypothetical protein